MYLTIAWLILGLVLATIFLILVRRLGGQYEMKIIGIGLVVAALVYVSFSIGSGNSAWVFLESGGVLFYGLFFWLAVRYSALWLAIGWGLHPVWDLGLHLFGPGHGIAPDWYVIACFSFDLLVAGYVLYRMADWRAGQPLTGAT